MPAVGNAGSHSKEVAGSDPTGASSRSPRSFTDEKLSKKLSGGQVSTKRLRLLQSHVYHARVFVIHLIDSCEL